MVPKMWRAKDIIFRHSGPFFALLPPYEPENQNFEKMKKTPEDIFILQVCTILTVILRMVPEIWSATDKIFCHFGLFLPF